MQSRLIGEKNCTFLGRKKIFEEVCVLLFCALSGVDDGDRSQIAELKMPVVW